MSVYEPDLDALFANYDEEDQNTPLVKHLRKEVERAAKASKKAFEEGKTAADKEFQLQQARDKALADVPAILRDKFADIDPADKASIDVRKQQLQADGVRWGESVAAPEQPADQPPSLDRMAQVAAGGSIPNNDDDRAQKIKQQIDAGRGYASDDDQAFFEGYVETSRQNLTQARSRGM